MNQQEFDIAIHFHGHRCPAMPLGYRVAKAAMNRLGVERSEDKELYVISETGKGHAAGCFLDGIMSATGCTYGKSNIEKLYYNKMALTLIDLKGKRSVRIRLKDDFFANILKSPFVSLRKKGVPPQDISEEITAPLIQKVLNMPEEMFVEIEPVQSYHPDVQAQGACFETGLCTKCGERTFTNKLKETKTGPVCIPCGS